MNLCIWNFLILVPLTNEVVKGTRIRKNEKICVQVKLKGSFSVDFDSNVRTGKCKLLLLSVAAFWYYMVTMAIFILDREIGEIFRLTCVLSCQRDQNKEERKPSF